MIYHDKPKVVRAGWTVLCCCSGWVGSRITTVHLQCTKTFSYNAPIVLLKQSVPFLH